MLPKIHRLHSDQEIKDLVRTGASFFLPEMLLKYKKNKENISKIAFVVSTKVDKRAVVRNKLARRLREILHSQIKDIRRGYSLLIIAKKKTLDLDFAQLKKQIFFALNKTKLLYNDQKHENFSKNK